MKSSPLLLLLASLVAMASAAPTAAPADIEIKYKTQPQLETFRYGECFPLTKDNHEIQSAKFARLSSCHVFQDKACQVPQHKILLPYLNKVDVALYLDVGARIAGAFTCYELTGDPTINELVDKLNPL